MNTILAERTAAEVTLAELAEASGYSIGYVHLLETTDKGSRYAVKAILDALPFAVECNLKKPKSKVSIVTTTIAKWTEEFTATTVRKLTGFGANGALRMLVKQSKVEVVRMDGPRRSIYRRIV